MRLDYQVVLKPLPILIGWIQPWVKTDNCPSLEIEIKNQNFVESLTSASQFQLIDSFLAMTDYLPV